MTIRTIPAEIEEVLETAADMPYLGVDRAVSWALAQCYGLLDGPTYAAIEAAVYAAIQAADPHWLTREMGSRDIAGLLLAAASRVG